MTATAIKSRKSKDLLSGTALNVGELLATLQSVGHAVGGRAASPAMRCVLVGDGKIIASNGSVRIEAACGIDSAMLLPHDRLVAILKACSPKDTITLTLDSGACLVKSSGYRWLVHTESADSFPAWKIGAVKPVARFPADQFRRMVKAVVYAVDEDACRYAVGGVCIDVTDGTVSFVATDGRRLSKVEAEVEQAVDNRQVIVPEESLEIMGKLAEGDGAVQLEVTDREIVCTIDGGPTVKSLLLTGVFPDWRRAIPDRPDAVPHVVDRDALVASVRAARVCHDDTSRGVMFSFGQKGIKLRSHSEAKGEADVHCGVISSGNCVNVKLDPAFVMQFLNALPADGDPEIKVEAVDAGAAVVMRTESYLGLVMPMSQD